MKGFDQEIYALILDLPTIMEPVLRLQCAASYAMQNIVSNSDLEADFREFWSLFEMIDSLRDDSKSYVELVDELLSTVSKNMWIICEKCPG